MFGLDGMPGENGPHRLTIYHILGQVIIDILVILLAYIVAFLARSIFTLLELQTALVWMLFCAVATPLVLYRVGIYRQIWRLTSGYGVTIIADGMVISSALFTLADICFLDHPLPLAVIWLGGILGFGGLVVTRYHTRVIRRMLWWGRNARRDPSSASRVLVVGANEAGQNLVWRLKHRLPQIESEYVVMGFIDDDESKQGRRVEEVPVLGRFADLSRIVEANHVDLILIAVPVDTPEGRRMLDCCERSKARIKLLPDMVSYLNTKQGGALLRKVEPHDLIGRGCISHHGGVALNLLDGKRILVTGAAGSIGSELCRQLAGFPICSLTLLDNNESGLHDLNTELATRFPKLMVVPVLADITLRKTLRDVFQQHQPEVIFHAAAYKHVPMLEHYPNEGLRVNIGGTHNLAELAQQFGVERFVLISTDKAVHPSSVMGATKRACELLLRALAQKPGNRTVFTAVRFGNVLGSRGSVLPTFNQQIDNGGPVTITDRRMKRFFMSIPEAVNLVIHACCLTTSNDVFLLRMGEEVPIVSLAERMIRLRGLRPYVDIPIEFTGVRPGEKLYEELNTGDEEVFDTMHPGIIRLKDKRPYYDAKVFLEYIDQMSQMQFEAASAVLAYLSQAETEAMRAPQTPRNIAISLLAEKAS